MAPQRLLHLLLLALLPVSISACGTAPTRRPEPPAYLEFRTVLKEGQELSRDQPLLMEFDGKPLRLGPPRRFLLAEARVEDLLTGQTAVRFFITSEQVDDFRRWTAARINQRIAVILEGEILAAPVVKVPLPGEGLIVPSGPNAADRAEEIADRLKRD